MKMPSLYFAYGANMHPENMKHRCPGATPLRAMNLQDWKLKFYNHATILPKKGACVPGVLWAITPACERSLDAFEGYPTYYTKRTWSQDGIDFFFYEMTSSNQFGKPDQYYVADIIDSYKYWNISKDHLTTYVRNFTAHCR